VSKINVKQVFGTSVRDRRNTLGISQEELAERANLHRTYVSDIERGIRNPSLDSIERLAHALETSIPALFPRQEFHAASSNAGNGHNRDLVEILLVEDNEGDVELTLRAFKKARFTNRVHVVNNGAEALDYLFSREKYVGRGPESRFLVILLDLNLPKVSGLEVLRRIKGDKRTSQIPVVVLTVSMHASDIAECRRLGAENYIVKPVDFERLSRTTPLLNLDWALLGP